VVKATMNRIDLFNFQSGFLNVIFLNSEIAQGPCVGERTQVDHFLLNKNNPLLVDRAVHVKFRSNLSKQGSCIDEMEAIVFEAEILMPQDFIAREFEQNTLIDVLDEGFIV
jgi:hypothetical protein